MAVPLAARFFVGPLLKKTRCFLRIVALSFGPSSVTMMLYLPLGEKIGVEAVDGAEDRQVGAAKFEGDGDLVRRNAISFSR